MCVCMCVCVCVLHVVKDSGVADVSVNPQTWN